MHTFHFEVLVFYVLLSGRRLITGLEPPSFLGTRNILEKNPCVEGLATGRIAPFAVMAMISSEIFNSISCWVAVIGIVFWERELMSSNRYPLTASNTQGSDVIFFPISQMECCSSSHYAHWSWSYESHIL